MIDVALHTEEVGARFIPAGNVKYVDVVKLTGSTHKITHPIAVF